MQFSSYYPHTHAHTHTHTKPTALPTQLNCLVIILIQTYQTPRYQETDLGGSHRGWCHRNDHGNHEDSGRGMIHSCSRTLHRYDNEWDTPNTHQCRRHTVYLQ